VLERLHSRIALRPVPRILGGYLVAPAVAALTAFPLLGGASAVQTAAFLTVFPLGVLLVAARFGIGPAVAGACGGVLAYDFLFVQPTLSLAVREGRDALALALILAVTVAASFVVERLRRRAATAQEQASAERLRSGVLNALSHDLRTPLTAIVGASAALCEEGLGPGERHQFCRMVADEALRLDRLVTRLLELTRLECRPTAGMRHAQAIDEVIGSALRRLDPHLAGVLVRTDVPEDVPLADFDPVLIEQVIVNLMENAVRYAGRENPIAIAARTAQESILVEVADRGPGVRRGEEERVFEKLYRGASARSGDGGTGLGLTICRAIITAHRGRIWLENRAGGGAVVRFTLPVHEEALAISGGEPDAKVSRATGP
jgi:two-component system sensor histidine kinase KdpD